MPSWRVTRKASLSNQITHFGIMGGLSNSRVATNTNRATNTLRIPKPAATGLQFMQMHNLLSKNPQGSGGVGRMVKSKPCNCTGVVKKKEITIGEEISDNNIPNVTCNSCYDANGNSGCTFKSPISSNLYCCPSGNYDASGCSTSENVCYVDAQDITGCLAWRFGDCPTSDCVWDGITDLNKLLETCNTVNIKHNSQTVTSSITVPQKKTIIISQGASFIVDITNTSTSEGLFSLLINGTLINNGTIIFNHVVTNGASLLIKGSYSGSGSIIYNTPIQNYGIQISQSGNANINKVTFNKNLVSNIYSSGWAYGIYSEGTLTLSDVLFNGNLSSANPSDYNIVCGIRLLNTGGKGSTTINGTIDFAGEIKNAYGIMIHQQNTDLSFKDIYFRKNISNNSYGIQINYDYWRDFNNGRINFDNVYFKGSIEDHSIGILTDGDIPGIPGENPSTKHRVPLTFNGEIEFSKISNFSTGLNMQYYYHATFNKRINFSDTITGIEGNFTTPPSIGLLSTSDNIVFNEISFNEIEVVGGGIIIYSGNANFYKKINFSNNINNSNGIIISTGDMGTQYNINTKVTFRDTVTFNRIIGGDSSYNTTSGITIGDQTISSVLSTVNMNNIIFSKEITNAIGINFNFASDGLINTVTFNNDISGGARVGRDDEYQKTLPACGIRTMSLGTLDDIYFKGKVDTTAAGICISNYGSDLEQKTCADFYLEDECRSTFDIYTNKQCLWQNNKCISPSADGKVYSYGCSNITGLCRIQNDNYNTHVSPDFSKCSSNCNAVPASLTISKTCKFSYRTNKNNKCDNRNFTSTTTSSCSSIVNKCT